MPIYEYQCKKCGAAEELLQSSAEAEAPTCGACGAPMERVISLPSRQRGLYSRPAGKTCCGADERCDKPPCGEGGSCCGS